MPKTEMTKQLIANALKQLASSKHPDKISIGEILEAAGLNRQTFYYHFQDKQDLIGWIFDADIAKLTDKAENGTLLDDVLEYLHSERTFYIAALTSDAQNNLKEHIFMLFTRRISNDILRIAGNRAMDEMAIVMTARFFAHGICGSLVQWAQEGMNDDGVQFSQRYAPLVQELLAFSVNHYIY